jgi:putative acetyltransferase
MLTIRPERREDADAVEQVNTEAFGAEGEARLVNAVRPLDAYVPELSLVAEREGTVVAHALFSRVQIEGNPQAEMLLALGPVAVLPERQRQGIGTMLIRAGLERAAALGFAGVVLVGHPSYYPRFGFRSAKEFGLRLPFPVEEEAFMALPLRPGGLDAAAGTVVYSEPFLQF